jgi:ornithine cyclodeaminase/alanine dehydrogenase-like protein (mu-crystallin family)
MLESASLPYVSPAEVARLLPYAEAVDELRAAFSEPRRDSPERVRVEIPRGELLLMPAFGPEGVGVKLVTLHGRDSESPHPRVQGIYVLFSADGLAPELILDGAALTERRTAAVSALATQCLARENASRLVVFGTGRQARAHVDAVCSVRDIEYVGIVGRSSAEQVTVFKSVGIADEDLVLVLVRKIARRLGVGRREATMYKRRLP